MSETQEVNQESVRAAFEDFARSRALSLDTEKDAWGQDKYAHSHVDAMWFGWINANTQALSALSDSNRMLEYANRDKEKFIKIAEELQTALAEARQTLEALTLENDQLAQKVRSQGDQLQRISDQYAVDCL